MRYLQERYQASERKSCTVLRIKLYAMERGGWKTKSTLNRVYQHTFTAERQAVDQKIDQYFESLLF